jgi:hypothetical protein
MVSSENPISFEDKDGNLIRFNANTNHHVILKIRLLYDGLSQAEFFRSYVEAYINNDEIILEFVEKLKEKKGKRSKVKMNKTRKLHDIAKRIQKDFKLSDEELESIFELPMEELAEL